MTDVMLIDVDNVKKLGYVHKNVLPDTVTVTIKRVQVGMLRKLMGRWAYDKLIAAVSASLPPTPVIVPLTADLINLVENYVQPYLVACVDYRIIYPLTFRSRSKSVGKGTDENHVPAEIAELIKLKDQMLQDVTNYAELLQQQLCFLPGYTYECNFDCFNECFHYHGDSNRHRLHRNKTKTPWNAIKFR